MIKKLPGFYIPSMPSMTFEKIIKKKKKRYHLKLEKLDCLWEG